mmetsp:Transcript_105057/g.321993  ORF Transcript_105057/g.321993 Transcript_105057/m.321993 type:complete len:234 (+) Transcript_105057:1273-1974(+)
MRLLRLRRGAEPARRPQRRAAHAVLRRSQGLRERSRRGGQKDDGFQEDAIPDRPRMQVGRLGHGLWVPPHLGHPRVQQDQGGARRAGPRLRDGRGPHLEGHAALRHERPGARGAGLRRHRDFGRVDVDDVLRPAGRVRRPPDGHHGRPARGRAGDELLQRARQPVQGREGQGSVRPGPGEVGRRGLDRWPEREPRVLRSRGQRLEKGRPVKQDGGEDQGGFLHRGRLVVVQDG